MEKVAPSERFRQELDEVLAGVDRERDPVEVVGRLGARLILQQALEDEVTEFLGRRRYQRAQEAVSHRNGHEPRTIKTTSGSMDLERPRVRNAGKLGFESRVLGKGVARTHALESLVISSFLRGLSTRDVEAAALEEVFEEPIASKSTVSRICEDTRERYRCWCERRLEEHDSSQSCSFSVERQSAWLYASIASSKLPSPVCSHSSKRRIESPASVTCSSRASM